MTFEEKTLDTTTVNKSDKAVSKPDISLNYQTLFSLFMFGSVLGFVLEGIWYYIKLGVWESHSAVVWGPFCLIYGIGAVAVYLVSCRLYDKNMFLQFAAFSFSGAAVEYFSGLFQEVCFGSISWDYSDHLLNIGGRISLQMAFVWGAFGILFVRCIFPHLNRLLCKLYGKKLKVACVILTVFMVVDIAVSVAAVFRWHERQNDMPASYRIEMILDKYYGDEVMTKIYPRMKFQ